MDYTFTCERFDIRRTLFCGQAFRWKELDGRFCGIAGGRYAEISDNGRRTGHFRIAKIGKAAFNNGSTVKIFQLIRIKSDIKRFRRMEHGSFVVTEGG